MHKNLSGVACPLLGSLTFSGILIFNVNQVLAQVTPDNTLGNESSVVNPRDATSDSIDGGAIRGQNLFHSFQEFNVGADRGVYFANPDAVTNIFSRVTGNDVSNILGTLGVDGAANLFLINPNGIIFGEGASLDVQGSFAATTADGIEFGEQGFFSASNPESPNLLTINPSAYLFNQVAPGAIVNNSRATISNIPVGLFVDAGKSLSLIGGDINLDGGIVNALGGKVDLGGLAAAGTIGINNNGSLSFPNDVAKADVFLSKGAFVNVSAIGGGAININANDLKLTEESKLQSGINIFGINGVGNPEAVAGDITINTTGEIALSQESGILNQILEENTGKAGNINIQTSSLNVKEGSLIDTGTLGKGDGGNIKIAAVDNISVDGYLSNIISGVSSSAEGNAGDIEITTDSLTLTNEGRINNSTDGKGNAGNIKITATGNINTVDESSIASVVSPSAEGNAGEIKITTGNLLLTNIGRINTSNNGQGNAGNIKITATGNIYANQEGKIISGVAPSGEGNAGDIEITANNLTLINDSLIGNTNNGKGNSGSIKINAGNDISLDNSYISSLVTGTTEGSNFGEIKITTNNLLLTNSGRINTSTSGKGNAGSINIAATSTISIDGFIDEQDGSRFYSGIFSVVDINGEGSGGDIEIATDNLILTNSGQINTSTLNKGNAGRIKISANNISVDNSLILSIVESSAEGNGGEVNIETSNLTLTNIGQINASTFGKGNGGNIKVTSDRISINGRSSGIFTGSSSLADVNAGNIEIDTSNLTLTNRGKIVSSTFSKGDAGNIKITAMNNISVDNSFITSGSLLATEALTIAEGDGGNIEIQTPNLFLNNRAILTAQSSGLGNAGNIKVNAESITLERNSSIFASNTPLVDISNTLYGGNINLQISDNITLRNNSDISTEASSNANGGNIDVTADAVIAFDDSDIFAFAADGQGGDITLDTPAYFGENFTLNSLDANPGTLENNSRADINATGTVSGVVLIPDVSFIQNGLTNLPDNSINTDELVANSCVSPVGKRQEGKFIITGTGGLPVRPGNDEISDFATGEVRSVPSNNSGWHRGEPIVEPQGVYRLTNGKLVMSRECN